MVKPISLYIFSLVCECTIRRNPHLEFVFEKSLSNFTFPGPYKSSEQHHNMKERIGFVVLTFRTIGNNGLLNSNLRTKCG